MGHLEPVELTVGALSRHLVEEPLARVIRVSGSSFKAKLVILVVVLDEIFNDSARFSECEINIRIVNSGKTTIWVDRFVGRFLQLAMLDGLYFKGEIKL